MKKIRSKFVGITAVALLTGAASVYAEGTLNVSNWAEYMAEDTISNFAEEYGIEVVFTPYDSQEAIESKLLAGSSGYDVVSHASSAIARLLQGNILQKVDKSKLPNMKHMREDVLTQMNEWDPGNEYIVPYMWGTNGVTFNRELLLETYPDAPIGTLDLIFDPKHAEQVGKCGLAILDSPTDVIPLALAYMGLDPSSTNRADYEKAGEMLAQIRPYVKTFDNYAYQRMPQKEFCVAVTWGPDGLLAMSQAAEANTGVVLEFFLPKSASFWVDGWVIPADAENVENAHLFMNYMMRPEVAANDTNFTWYATANKDAVPMIEEAVTSNTAAFPTPEQVATMWPLKPIPPKVERVRTRTWTDFKAGN